MGRRERPLSEAEVVERFVGPSEAYMVSEIERHFGHPLAPDWEDEYRQLYQDAFAAELKPVEGVLDALERLDPIGLPTCVASSAGMRVFEYAGGLVPAERLGHATAVFTDMRDLPRLVQEAGSGIPSRA
jgi:phosphoglycolate phosphatase-like HAD superfamily hydrolase